MSFLGFRSLRSFTPGYYLCRLQRRELCLTKIAKSVEQVSKNGGARFLPPRHRSVPPLLIKEGSLGVAKIAKSVEQSSKNGGARFVFHPVFEAVPPVLSRRGV